MALRRALGEKRGIAISLSTVAELALAAADGRSAIPLLEETLGLVRELGHVQFEAMATAELGVAGLSTSDREQPSLFLEQALALCLELGDGRVGADSLSGLAAVAGLEGDVGRAARLFGAAEAIREAFGIAPSPSSDRSTTDCSPRSQRRPMSRRSQPAGRAASSRARRR